ncbi:hypothetical protein [Haloglomus litoreum]|uniref:hypothetical protein n=1 Tax=Haloglomus litoreum TaxID=3034026 RepID=UPI0023E7818F|nr:hypothetical protein [Haloglomus sp. DT116]
MTEESDGTLKLRLPNVNKDAVTEVEGLLVVQNEGTQPVNVYFEDDSDAVTFRTTGDDTSLEGVDNAVSLGVGSQIRVGATVDTLNNDVDGALLDSVTINATVDPVGAGQSSPTPQYVVSPSATGGDNNRFSSVVEAVVAAEPGSTIGFESGTYDISDDIINAPSGYSYGGQNGALYIDKAGLTFTSLSGSVTLQNTEIGDVKVGTSDGLIQVHSSGVTFDGIEVETDYGALGSPQSFPYMVEFRGDDGTFRNGAVRLINGDSPGTPGLYAEAVSGLAVNNSAFQKAGAVIKSLSSGTFLGNDFDAPPAEGIVIYGSISGGEYSIRDNRVQNNGSTNGLQKLEVQSTSVTINGASTKDGLFRTLITENTVDTARVAGGDGVTVDADETASSVFNTISSAISQAGQGGYLLVKDGDYAGFNVGVDDLTIEAAPGVRPTIDANLGKGTSSRIVQLKSGRTGFVLRGFEVLGTDTSLSGESGVGFAGSDSLVEDVLAENCLTGIQFYSGSSNNTARNVTVRNSQVGVSPSGSGPHLVESSDFTGLISGDYNKSPEGLGASAPTTSRNNNYGEGVFLRAYDNDAITSDGDFFGTNGEDGEVVATDDDTTNITVKNVVTTPNEDAGIQ